MKEEEIGRLLGIATVLAFKVKECPGVSDDMIEDALKFVALHEVTELTPRMLASEGIEIFRKLKEGVMK